MNQEIFALLPRHAGPVPLCVGIAGCVIGFALWIAGARGNRSLVTLVFVSAGAIVGMRLPQRFEIGLASWVGATVLALLLGWIGFSAHRFWSGMALGSLIALCALVVVFEMCHPDIKPVVAGREAGLTWLEIVKSSWSGLAVNDKLMLIVMSCTSMCAGLTMAMVWHRVGISLLYSLLGFFVFAGFGLYLVENLDATLLGRLQVKPMWSWVISTGLILAGAGLQWMWLGGRRLRTNPVPKSGKRPIEVAF